MDNSKLSELVKSAVKVNLQYSASLLDLSKDYIKSMGTALSSGVATEREQTSPEANTQTQDKTSARIPLIVAGRAGETANATFAVHNTSGIKGTVSMQFNTEFEGVSLEVEPSELTLDVGGSEFVRILAKITNKTAIDTDMPGFVLIPELGIKVAEFVVRRLPDKQASKKKVSSTSRKRSPKKQTNKLS